MNSSFSTEPYGAIFGDRQWILYLQTFILLSTSIFAIVINLQFFRLIIGTKILQHSVKWFVLSLTLAILVQTGYLVGHCIHNLLFLSKIEIFNDLFCKIFQFFNRCSSAVVNFSMLVIAIDQAIATFKLAGGKLRKSGISFLPYLISFVIWIVAGVSCIPLFYSSSSSEILQLSYCHSSVVSHSIDQIILSFSLILFETIGFILFFTIYSKTKFYYDHFCLKTSKTSSLAERFQMRQTLNTTKAILKWSVVQVVIYLICFSLRVVHLVLVRRDDNSYELLIYLIMIQLQFYCIFNILHPVLLIRLHPSIGKALVQIYPYCSLCFWRKCPCFSTDVHPDKEDVVDYHVDSETYNDMLARAWNKN